MINSSPQAVFFDFDGTLADTAPDMIAALNHWCNAHGRQAAIYQQARGLCSGGARALLRFCGVSEQEMSDAVSEYLRCYENTGYRHSVLFAGMEELLSRLHRARRCWGVVTNKPQRYFAPIAERLLTQWQPCALIARDDNNALPAKPHPATLLAAAKQCGIPPQQCVYVGDDKRDGEAAQAAGMPFIAVTWGYWREEQWQEPDSPPITAKCTHPAQLLEQVLGE